MNGYNLWCIIFTCFGAFFYGYDSGLTTSIIAYPEFIEYYGFNSVTLGALGSSYYAGQTIGSLANFWIPDRFGRLWSVRFACVIGLLGCGMQTGAQGLGVLLAGRAIGGFSCGLIFALCPLYASEMSPPHVRGRVGGLYRQLSVNVNVSYAITEWMGLGISYLSGDVKFRVFLGLQLLVAVLMLVGSIWMPESPRWLAAHGRPDEALAILKRLHGTDVHHEPGASNSDKDEPAEAVPFYQREFNQIESQIQLEREQGNYGVWTIFSRPSYRKRLYIALFYYFFQQATGVIPLQNYQTILYSLLGLTGKMPLILVGVWGTAGTIVSIIGASLFDKLGRRKSFFISITGVIVGSVMLVIFWARFEAGGNTSETLGALAVFSMFVFLCGFGWIMNAFAYTYPPEILPTDIRATGMALGFGIKMAWIICLVQVTPIAIESISWKYFLVFIFLDVIFLLGVYFYFPETMNTPLEEIARLFGDDVAVTLDEAGGKGNRNEEPETKDDVEMLENVRGTTQQETKS
ncbi:uncharacterized protein LTR77_004981 [Saxophila tyrrhenica]|uniref:Major facilitator superfamily (MFS) profile domain-containing protein n=1 Tax=Saxophila tyrrhenica TaxID=1690608 RepID=A0AAV9PAZ8_9PEZI|nr:hypothetical protein LTR77_004981 [Saxophila tyrrhenica]